MLFSYEFFFFFFNDTATTEIYTLSLHDALPISPVRRGVGERVAQVLRDVLERPDVQVRSEEHTSELQSHHDIVCSLLLEKKPKAVIALERFNTKLIRATHIQYPFRR